MEEVKAITVKEIAPGEYFTINENGSIYYRYGSGYINISDLKSVHSAEEWTLLIRIIPRKVILDFLRLTDKNLITKETQFKESWTKN